MSDEWPSFRGNIHSVILWVLCLKDYLDISKEALLYFSQLNFGLYIYRES